MARIRSIKPEFPQSETIGKLSRDARLLFIMLWTIVDDEGRARAASRMLASLLFPYDDDAPASIEGWLAELERESCIRRYEVDGSRYLDIPNWLKHQKIDKASKSKLPQFDDASRTVAKPREPSTPDLGSRIKDHSEADASGAEAPEPTDPIERAWKLGVPILVAMKVNERDARSNVGRWLRDTQNDGGRVLAAIQRARDHGTEDPIPLVGRILKPVHRPEKRNGTAFKDAFDDLRQQVRAAEDRPLLALRSH
ncbi:hypothetical protein [Enterovirga sp. CN4-39]|uniref:hypothetical protein n=1 Tax=Enterovirga sp. CN4-39 TaxID=3400910 RepID=UPI003C016D33